MTEDLSLKPFERISVSKLDTWEMCPRHYHFQFALGLVEEVTPKQQQNRTLGEQVDSQIETWLKAPVGTAQLSGAAAAVSRHYPVPGQSCVDVQRWVRSEWAGAPWIGKIDLLTGPSTVWGPLNRAQKHGLVRITDLKSTSDLKWAKTAEQIDRNRQLHMYASGVWRERQKAIPNLFEVSQVVVERSAPHRCQSIVRVSDEETILELEEGDRPLVRGIVASHEEEDTLALDPAGDPGVCERWYGYRCAFYERCYGSKSVFVPQSLGALVDAAAGRGSGGVGRTIDSIAAETNSKGSLSDAAVKAGYGPLPDELAKVADKIEKQEDSAMLSTPDAAKSQNAKIEGENARYRPRTIVQGKSYVAVQGDRHGRTWEFRMLGDRWIIRVADKPGPIEAVPGFFPVDTQDESAKGSVPDGTGEKLDIVGLRAIFTPFLEAWDAKVATAAVASKKEEQTQARAPVPALEEEEIFGQAQKQIEEQSKILVPNEDRIKELTSVGLTDAQARNLVDGGITLEALRLGDVRVQDLTRCKGIGKGGAEKILSRFAQKTEPEKVQKDQAARGEEKIERPSKVESEEEPSEKPPVVEEKPQEKSEPKGAYTQEMTEVFSEAQQMAGRIAELEQQLTAARLRITDLLEKHPTEQGGLSGFRIFIGCRPAREHTVTFLDVIQPYLDSVARGRRKADVSQIDPGYLVPGLLSEVLHADPPVPCSFTVSERDQVWGWVRRYFLSLASEVVVTSVIP